MRARAGIVRLAVLVVALGGLVFVHGAEQSFDLEMEAILDDPRFAPLLLKALQSRDAGKVDDALEHLRQVNNAIKRVKGANHPDQLPVLDLAAEILFDAGRLDDAVTPLKRAVSIREGLIARGQAGNQEVAMASSLLLMGRVHASRGRFDSGLEALTKAVRVLDESLGRDHEATDRARRELAEAVAIFERTLGLEHPATLKAQRERVAVEVLVGDYAAAARVLDGMLAAERQRHGGETADTLAVAAELARMVQYAGRPEDAAGLVESAVERAERAGVSRPAVAQCLRDLAEIQLANDEFLPAQRSATKALGIDSSLGEEAAAAAVLDRLLLLLAGEADAPAAGEDLSTLSGRLLEYASQRHAEAACGLRLAARVALASGEADLAAELVHRAVDLDESLHGDAHPDTLSDRLLLGQSRLAKGERKESLELLKAAHRDARTALGASHVITLDIAAAVAECETELDRVGEAEEVVLALLSREVPYAGRRLEDRLVGVVDGLAEACEKRNEASRANTLREGLVSLRRRQFGANDARLAQTLAAFGDRRLAAKRWEDAIRFYSESLAIRERSGEPDHPEAAVALLAMGKAYRYLKRYDDARDALTRALAVWTGSVGPSHPVACETLKLLALTELSLGRAHAALPLMERLLAAYDDNPDSNPEDVARLLMKLVEVRTARGDADVARNYLARALALRSASDAVVTAVDIADFAKRNQLMEDAAGMTIADAVHLADEEARPAAADGGAAIAVRQAWELHAAGKRDAARDLLRLRLGQADGGDGKNSPALADLLVALADMREVALEVGPAVESYRRAATIRGTALGDPHPATITAALRLAGVGVAGGNPALARSTLGFATEQAAWSAEHAGAAEAARDVAMQTALIAAAANEPELAVEAIRVQSRLCEETDVEARLKLLETLRWPTLLVAQPRGLQALRESLVDVADRGRGSDARLSRALTIDRAAAASARGDHAAAETLLAALCATEERSLAAGDPRLAADLLRLAAARGRSGKGAADEPRKRAWRAIETGQRGGAAAGGGDDIDACIDLARTLVADGDVERAERVLRSRMEAVHVPGVQKLVTSGRLQLELGEIRLALRPQQAAIAFSEAMRTFRDALGGGHGLCVAAALRLEAASRRAVELEDAAIAGDVRKIAPLAGPNQKKQSKIANGRATEMPDEFSAAAATNAPLGAMGGRPQRSAGEKQPAAMPLAASVTDQRKEKPPDQPAVQPGSKTAVKTAADGPEAAAPGGRPAAARPQESQLAALVASDALVSAGSRAAPQRRDPSSALQSAGRTLPPLQRAEALKRMADSAMAAGNVKVGLDSLRQLGSLQWKLYGGDDPRVISTMLRYADLLLETGNLARGSTLVARIEKESAAGSPERVLALVARARVNRDRDDLPAAVSAVEEAARQLADIEAVSAAGEPAAGNDVMLSAAVAVARAAVDMGLSDVAKAACDRVRAAAKDRELPQGVAERSRAVLVEAHLQSGEIAEAETDARWLLDAALARDKPDAAMVAVRRVLLARTLIAATKDEWRKQAAAAARALGPLLAEMTTESCPAWQVEATRRLAEACVAGGDPGIAMPLFEGLRNAAIVCLPAGHEQTAPALLAAAGLAEAGGREDFADACREAAEAAAAIRRGTPADASEPTAQATQAAQATR